MSSSQVRICPDCGTSLSVESATCWLCKERNKPAPRSAQPAVIQRVDEGHSLPRTITWINPHRWSFNLFASLLYAGSLAFFELVPNFREDRPLEIAIFALASFFFSCGLVAGMILIMDLIFGTRAFPWRLLEGLFWVLLTLALYVGLLSFSDLSGNQLREIGSRCLAIPLAIMLIQLPLWAVAYAKNWRLSRDDAQIDRPPWTIRDWMLGCFLLSASLALARAGGDSQGLILTTMNNLQLGLFLLLPAVLYGLAPRAGRGSSWSAGEDGLLLFFLFLCQFATLLVNRGTAPHDQRMLLIYFLSWQIPPIIAVLLLRRSGYRLRAARAALPNSQPVAQT